MSALFNGIGIDFGTGAARAAVYQNGKEVAFLRIDCADPGGVAYTIDRDRVLSPGDNDISQKPVPRWLRIESVKAALGTARGLHNTGGFPVESPEEKVRNQFRDLRDKIEQQLRIKTLAAVISVPACYGMNQRAALRSGAEAAGFGKVSLVDDSIAAVLHACRDTGKQEYVLAYCLGRSAFSVSVLSLEDEFPRPLNHEGSTQLGGQDFEALLVQDIFGHMGQQRLHSFSHDPTAVRELILRAEAAKIDLSSKTESPIVIGPFTGPAGLPFHEKFSVSRSRLNELIAPLVAHTIDLTRKSIQGAGLQANDICEVLLVGEAARTPLVKEELARAFGLPLIHAEHDAVARGAAIYASSLQQCFAPRAENELPSPEAQIGTEPSPDNGQPVINPQKPDLGADAPSRRAGADNKSVPEPEDRILAGWRNMRTLSGMGDIEQAIAAFEDMLKQAHEELSYLYSQRAAQLRSEDRIDEARIMLEEGLKHCPDNAHIRRRLAEIYVDRACESARLGLLGRCREHLRKSLLLDRDNVKAKRLLEELENKFGRKGKTIGSRKRKN